MNRAYHKAQALQTPTQFKYTYISIDIYEGSCPEPNK